MAYERLNQELAPFGVFVRRVLGSLAFVLMLIAISLAVGMLGYHAYGRMSWIDAYANAAMILSGMGPLAPMETFAGKLFAGTYALYSGLFLVMAAGLLLAPLLHRFLHRIHLDDDQPDAD